MHPPGGVRTFVRTSLSERGSAGNATLSHVTVRANPLANLHVKVEVGGTRGEGAALGLPLVKCGHVCDVHVNILARTPDTSQAFGITGLDQPPGGLVASGN